MLRADVLGRFRNDDAAGVRAVLRGLVDSGMVFAAGRGEAVTYRADSAEELQLGRADEGQEGFVNLVWVALNRYAPATAAQLAKALPSEELPVKLALDQLAQDGRARALSNDPEPSYDVRHVRDPARKLGGPGGSRF